MSFSQCFIFLSSKFSFTIYLLQASAELFLDILTKEEREALLNKKMEEIRKKNEALRKRHEV
jgi:hypothetical protein